VLLRLWRRLQTSCSESLNVLDAHIVTAQQYLSCASDGHQRLVQRIQDGGIQAASHGHGEKRPVQQLARWHLERDVTEAAYDVGLGQGRPDARDGIQECDALITLQPDRPRERIDEEIALPKPSCGSGLTESASDIDTLLRRIGQA
jgi:hypothetical protein